jgi:hypothetical protein
MSNFLTDGRLALLSALRAGETLDALVRTWFEFGPGLTRRHDLEPALCPVLGLAPAESAPREVANVEREVPQVLRVEVATAGQDAAPCEELVALVLACIDDANEDNLGLAAQGLAGLRVRSVRWAAVPRADAARLIWTAAVEVELLWRRM